MDDELVQSSSSNDPSTLGSVELHEPLPHKPGTAFIRVIHLHRDSKDIDAPLHATLKLIDLRTCPKFVALSYVWGEYMPEPDTICCNGYTISITRNCSNALRSLRAICGPVDIWVDAICINQDDEVEKIAQIRLMDEIYTWAQTVYIWLGQGNTRSVQALKCLKLASGFRSRLPGVPWTDSRKVMTARRDRFLTGLSIAYLYIRSLIPYLQRFQAYRVRAAFNVHHLDELLNREWIERAWTYQEIILASNPVIVCGNKTITWSCLQKGLDYLNNPVSPFHVRFIDLLRASFSYRGPSAAALGKRTSKITNACHSIRSFHVWRNLYNIWSAASRPTRWNDRTFRSFTVDAESGRYDWSLKIYQERFIEMEKSWHYARLMIALAAIILIPGALMGAGGYLMFLYYTEGSCSPYPSVAFHTKSLECRFYGIMTWVVFGLGGILCVLGVLITVYAVRTTPKVWYQSDENGRSVIGPVQALRERRATVPADKAFALHGVLQRVGISRSTPDYSKPLGEVYHGLFLDLLRHQTSLINLLVDIGPRLPGVPSWVPDWSSIHRWNWISPDYTYDNTTLYGASFPEPQMKISDDKLALWAIKKGTIGWMSDAFQEVATESGPRGSSEASIALAQAMRSFTEWVRVIGESASTQVDSTDSDALGSIYKALVGSPKSPSPEQFDIFKRWLYLIQSQLLDGPVDEPSSPWLSLSADPEVFKFTVSCCNQLAERRTLFVTAEGQVGSGPPTMGTGDRLVLLRGVAVPMVLRTAGKTENTFEVLGPAFISEFADLSSFNGSNFGHDWEAVYLV
ncbi:hypothetical protein JX265_006447 [Neoarthrinium moseri]|uniref:Heterokaryon incompatibility domain-containing protein n=1 Tax=Neoarthrinium moseri TaxID=1658444 RepID=A0A9Q0AQM5_9PEZI|nr:hypothetical protein JX265_006447 [Neoarthrinium moseri]